MTVVNGAMAMMSGDLVHASPPVPDGDPVDASPTPCPTGASRRKPPRLPDRCKQGPAVPDGASRSSAMTLVRRDGDRGAEDGADRGWC